MTTPDPRDEYRRHTISSLNVGIADRLTREAAERLRPRDPDRHAVQPDPYGTNIRATVDDDFISGRLVARLQTRIAAEILPPQRVPHRWTGEHDFVLTSTMPRHASWWQFFKDTYRSRWWAAWLVRRHPVRYVDVDVHIRETRVCAHDVTVEVGAAWTYPQAPLYLTGADVHLGPAVLKTWHDSGSVTFDLNADRP
jgi:hypothetical protein